MNFGLIAVEAALKAGCHHIDTTGEQGYIRAVRDQFGELYRQAGLLVVAVDRVHVHVRRDRGASSRSRPHGVDVLETATLCRGPRFAASGVTVGSTASIFELFRSEQCYLWEKQLVPHAPGRLDQRRRSELHAAGVLAALGRHVAAGLLPARRRACAAAVSYVGFYDNNVMQLVHGLGQKWEAEYKHLPKEHQDAVIKQIVDSTTPSMPPRERTTTVRTVDFAIGRGQLAAVRATVHGITAYISTGAAAGRGRDEAARR